MTVSNEIPASSRTVVGKVISSKMQKTIIVQTVRKEKHPLYGKYITKKSKMYAHDEKNECSEGDLVRIALTHPYSKTKSWVLREVVTPSSGESSSLAE